MAQGAERARGVVLVPLAEGFEEIEAVTIVDVLRRAGLEVRVAGLAPGPVRGSHGIACLTDCTLDEVQPDELAALVLPGGMPGSTNLAQDRRVLDLVQRLDRRGLPVAAICAAPLALAAAGILDGREATAHPSVRARLGQARVLDAPRVVRAGNVWTSQGPGTALEVSLALVEELCGAPRARELQQAMLART
jgi:4-methyl-5(b-hydroxyethyl)-thiazole monophosphate biosynthesis